MKVFVTDNQARNYPKYEAGRPETGVYNLNITKSPDVGFYLHRNRILWSDKISQYQLIFASDELAALGQRLILVGQGNLEEAKEAAESDDIHKLEDRRMFGDDYDENDMDYGIHDDTAN